MGKIKFLESAVKYLPLSLKNVLSINDRIIFIVGSGRSGTTYLTRVLKSQPACAIYPTEANNLFFPNQYPYSKSKGFTTPPIWIDPLTFSEFDKKARSKSFFRECKAIFGAYQKLKGGKIFICKTVMANFILEELLEHFPKAKFVILQRHGLSVALSYQKKELKKYSDPVYKQYLKSSDIVAEARQHHARYWNQCNKYIYDFLTKHPSICHVVRYEDLERDVEGVFTCLLRFIGIEAERNNTYVNALKDFKNMNYKIEAEISRDEQEHLKSLMQDSLQLLKYTT
jgi:hypothetical protein